MNAFQNLSIRSRVSTILLLSLKVLAGETIFPMTFVETTPLDEEEDRPLTLGHDTAISREDITTSRKDSIAEILEARAGITFSSFFGGANVSTPVLRGFAENSQLRTTVLLDGLALNRNDLAVSPWSQVSPNNLEKIRVLRGGRTVRYGGGASAGVIALTSRETTDEFQGSASWSLGSFETQNYRASIAIPLDQWGLSTDFNWSESEGFRENSAQESLNWSVLLQNRLSENPDALHLKAGIRLSGSQSYFQDPGPLTRDQFQSNPRQSVRDGDDVDSRSLRIAPYLEWQLGPQWSWDIRMASLLREREVNFFGARSNSDFINWDFESVLKRESEKWNLEWGARARHSSGDYDRESTRGDLQFADLSRTTIGAFGLFAFQLADSLTLSGGASWDHYQLAVNAQSPTDPTDPQRNYDESNDDSGWAFEVGLEYEWSEASTLWLRYDRPLRFPVLDEVGFYQGFTSSNPFNNELRPERGESVEIGLDIDTETWNASLTSFSQWMQDEIFFDALTEVNENLPEVLRLGLEAELRAQWKTWEAQLFYTQILARFREGIDEGRRVPLVPRLSITGSIEWKPADSFAIAVEGSFIGSSPDGNDRGLFGQTLQFESLPARRLWNLRVNSKISDHFSVFGRVNNLFDSQHAISKFSDGWYPGAGRQFVMGGEYEF